MDVENLEKAALAIPWASWQQLSATQSQKEIMWRARMRWLLNEIKSGRTMVDIAKQVHRAPERIRQIKVKAERWGKQGRLLPSDQAP